jgi:hypothetical protein
MGLESYLINIVFKKPVPQTEIKDTIEGAGAAFLADKSSFEQLDSFRHFYFEIRSDLGLTELYILLMPGKTMATSMSIRFSILSPSSVIDQTFSFLKKLIFFGSLKIFDCDNDSKELSLDIDKFKLNKTKIRKRQIVINNKTGLVIEGGNTTTDYIYKNNLIDAIWGHQDSA